ncbi:PTS glucose transporter subunit IIA [Pseudoalteromonas sp. GB56]
MNLPAEFCVASDLPKSQTIYSPVSGSVSPLDAAPIALMSLGLLGSGVCVQMRGHRLVAPCDGQLVDVCQGAKQWRFKASNGLHIMVHLYLEEHTITNKAKLSYINATRVKQGEEIAYFDLRQFNSTPTVAIIVTNSSASKRIYFCHKQVEANDPLLFVS